MSCIRDKRWRKCSLGIDRLVVGGFGLLLGLANEIMFSLITLWGQRGWCDTFTVIPRDMAGKRRKAAFGGNPFARHHIRVFSRQLSALQCRGPHC